MIKRPCRRLPLAGHGTSPEPRGQVPKVTSEGGVPWRRGCPCAEACADPASDTTGREETRARSCSTPSPSELILMVAERAETKDRGLEPSSGRRRHGRSSPSPRPGPLKTLRCSGAPGRTRTADAHLRTVPLYPLSYGGATIIVPERRSPLRSPRPRRPRRSPGRRSWPPRDAGLPGAPAAPRSTRRPAPRAGWRRQRR